MVLRLAQRQLVRDLDRRKPDPARHGILIGDHRPERAQLARIAHHPQAARDGKGAAIVKSRKGDTDQAKGAEIGQDQRRIIGVGEVKAALMLRNLVQRNGRGFGRGAKALIGNEHAHAADSFVMGTVFPLMK